MSSAPSTWIPAWSSCCSSRSTGTFSTSANCATVTSAINELLSLRFFREPVLAGFHDYFSGALRLERTFFDQFVDREVREVLAGTHPRDGQCLRQLLAGDLDEICGRIGAVDRFF